MAPLQITLELELGSTAFGSGFGSNFSSGFGGSPWVDKTNDVIRDPIRWSRGIFGVGPLDRIARPGSMTWTSDNSDQNSEGRPGLYTPGHVNALPGLRQGTRVRLRLSNGVTSRYVFAGRIFSIVPDPGVTGLQATTFVAQDWLSVFATLDAGDLALQAAVRADDLLQALIDSVPEPPANVDLDLGSDEYVFAYDDLGGDTPKAMVVAQDIVQSEVGFLYLRGDATDGETLRFENRQARALADVVRQYTREQLVNETTALEVPSDFTQIANIVEVQTSPRRVDTAATTVLIDLDRSIQVDAGATVTIFVDYRDPNNEAVFVGGKNMVALAANTDWTANGASDGTGANVTGNFTAVATYFGSRAMIVLTNAGGSTGYVRGPAGAEGLQGRGRGIYRYAPVTSRGRNQDSIDQFGTWQLPQPITLPYQSDQNVAQGVADYLANLYGGIPFPRRARLLTENDDDPDLLEDAILRDVGDLVGWTEDQTAISATGTVIHAVEQEITLDGVVRMWLTLAPADTTAVFIFDESLLDQQVFGFV